MSSVGSALVNTIGKLQKLKSLDKFALGSGTNLALRYNHHVSVDTHLFTNEIIGLKGLRNIALELSARYDDAIIGLDYPCNIDDQYIFLRFFVKQKDEIVKVKLNRCPIRCHPIFDPLKRP